MTFKLDTRYVRRAPDGQETVVKINNLQDVNYHKDLEKHGYKYTEVVMHSRPEECEACSA